MSSVTRSGRRIDLLRLLSGLTATILKDTIGRPRPYQANDPNAWFKGGSYQSFPSGEVTLQAVFRGTNHRQLLQAIPLASAGSRGAAAYDVIARLKSQAHWQTDVIVGRLPGIWFWALGNDAQHALVGTDTAGRLEHRIQQEVLSTRSGLQGP